MMDTTFKNKQERDDYLLLMKNFDDFMWEDEHEKDYDKNKAEYDKMWDEYYNRLPILQFSVCPYCSAPYHHTYDPFGFDGIGWGEWGMANKVQTNCEHARLIRSAYTFTSDLDPDLECDGVSVGPAIPYVIGRILRKNTMKAVVSKIEFASGDILYPIVYFSTEPPEKRALTADWDDNQYERCEVPKDKWDFHLRPWVESGHVLWCEPSDDGLALSTQPADACPFYGLKGHLGKQFVQPKGEVLQAFVPPRHIRPEGYEE